MTPPALAASRTGAKELSWGRGELRDQTYGYDRCLLRHRNCEYSLDGDQDALLSQELRASEGEIERPNRQARVVPVLRVRYARRKDLPSGNDDQRIEEHVHARRAGRQYQMLGVIESVAAPGSPAYRSQQRHLDKEKSGPRAYGKIVRRDPLPQSEYRSAPPARLRVQSRRMPVPRRRREAKRPKIALAFPCDVVAGNTARPYQQHASEGQRALIEVDERV